MEAHYYFHLRCLLVPCVLIVIFVQRLDEQHIWMFLQRKMKIP